MAGIALSAYKTELASLGFDAAQTAALNAAVNQARRDLVASRRWSWMEVDDSTVTAVVGQSTYNLAAFTGTGVATAAGEHRAVSSVRAVSGGAVTDLIPVTRERFDELADAAYGEKGFPRYYNVSGALLSDANLQPVLRIAPAPDAAYTLIVDWEVGVADLASDVATDALIPPRYKSLVALGAAKVLAVRQRDPNALQMFLALYNDSWKREAAADKRSGQRARQVVDSGVWDVYG